ncbi:hypothetical protein DESC_520026 [Desulfosarcina cetonica]|nr:hypothetical protein DESC_520026 [Desulfosarcina cetonica]
MPYERYNNRSLDRDRRRLNDRHKPSGNSITHLINCYKQVRDPDRHLQKLIISATASNDPKVIDTAFSEVQKRLAYDAMSGNPFREPSPAVSSQDSDSQKIFIGEIEGSKGRPFLYDKDLFNQHMLIIGMTGTGKTSLLILMLIQLIASMVKVLAFDYSKKGFRILKRFREAKDIIIIPAAEFMINFLQVPPFVDPQEWAIIFVSTFTRYFDLLSGSTTFLLNHLLSLYRDYGVFDNSGTFPTLYDLFDRIRYSKTRGYRSSQIKDTVLSRIEVVLLTFGKSFSYSKVVQADWIAENNCVFELASLHESVAKFYSAMIIMSIFAMRIASGVRGNILRNIIAFDECHFAFPKIQNYNIPTSSPLSQILAQGREVGLGFILANQSLDIDTGVIKNARCSAIFNMGSGDDIRKISRAMSLTPEQEAMIPRLGVGQSIIKVPMEEPFVIKTMPLMAS